MGHFLFSQANQSDLDFKTTITEANIYRTHTCARQCTKSFLREPQ